MNSYWTTSVLILSGWTLYLGHVGMAWTCFVISAIIAIATYGRMNKEKTVHVIHHNPNDDSQESAEEIMNTVLHEHFVSAKDVVQ